MKTTKKPPRPAKSPPATTVPLSPRQIALRKLYPFLAIGGVVILGTLLSIYGEDILLYRSKTKGFQNRAELREPKLNSNAPPGPAPEGMVWIPGGEFYMGVDPDNFPGDPKNTHDATLLHLVYVDGFWMDKTEVTNEEFAKFVKATGYVTDAEKKPTQEEFPDKTPDELKPFSIVFRKPTGRVAMNDYREWFTTIYGACWKRPDGFGSNILGRDNYPVVHISYNDAIVYCRWARKRLPTEAEWEFAARGGLDRKLYPWGDDLKPDGKWMANVWQGEFPIENTKEDGFEGAAPVGSFPPNAYGLYDVAGNVWEWCADWYRADYYLESPDKNPQGPISGFARHEIGAQKRVQRGGSFLCADSYCLRYVLGTRGEGEIGSAGVHNGFRCARDAK